MKGGIKYAVEVFAARHSRMFTVLQKFDELFLAVHAVVEYQHLVHYDATFAEKLYTLKRASSWHSEGTLSRFQRLTSLLTSVVLPYLCERLDAHCAALQRHPGAPFGDENETLTPLSATQRVFMGLYPLLRALSKLASVLYFIRYLFRDAKYFSPLLHLQGIVMRRVQPHELLQRQKHLQLQRQHAAKASGVNALFARLALLRDLGLEYAAMLLPIAFFSYRFVEWWYSEPNSRPVTLPVPPPPPPPPLVSAQDRVMVPADRTLCPICQQTRTNTAMLSTGFVFCYPCVFRYVQENGQCPVTHVKLDVGSISKIYDDDA
eukprot:TRINITY_DN1082_c0_g1_i1.p1 TRINITY_DN1082_c0_g1~~TRINITY_DN1082_c0_g1_i1.p1  ORF type:complete len:354 (+),score=64.45 TRINITY_DN1082_c0_g1_i1:107-1063(+)